MKDKVEDWIASMSDWKFQEAFASIIELYGVMFAEMKRRGLLANPADPPIKDKTV